VAVKLAVKNFAQERIRFSISRSSYWYRGFESLSLHQTGTNSQSASDGQLRGIRYSALHRVFSGSGRDLQSPVSTDMRSRGAVRRVVALDMGSVAPPKGHPDFGTLTVIQAFAIDAPGGVVLVDTGLGEAEPAIDALYSPTRRSLAEALLETGLSRERVSAIVVSHLHFDHAGALPEFSGLPIHVQRDERQAARQPRYTVRSRVEAPALRYIEHAGDGEVCEGVRVIATPGHTPGHQSVAIETERGLVILACQAAYTLEEWTERSFQHPAGALSAWDREAYAKSLDRLRAMNPIEVRFSHDRRIWLKMA